MKQSDLWGHAPRAGYFVLGLNCGRHWSADSYDVGWQENLSLEFPGEPKLGRLDLETDSARVGFHCSSEGGWWGMGDRGARGTIDIVSIDDNGLEVVYDLTVNALDRYNYQRQEIRDRTLRFFGRRRFTFSPRPDPIFIAGHGPLCELPRSPATTQEAATRAAP